MSRIHSTQERSAPGRRLAVRQRLGLAYASNRDARATLVRLPAGEKSPDYRVGPLSQRAGVELQGAGDHGGRDAGRAHGKDGVVERSSRSAAARRADAGSSRARDDVAHPSQHSRDGNRTLMELATAVVVRH